MQIPKSQGNFRLHPNYTSVNRSIQQNLTNKAVSSMGIQSYYKNFTKGHDPASSLKDVEYRGFGSPTAVLFW
jgi:hypothetical protein